MLSKDDRKRASVMTSDETIWDPHSVPMALTLKRYMGHVEEVEETLKRVAVRIDSVHDYQSCDPAAYIHTRICGVCRKESEDADDVDELGPIKHDIDCIMSTE